MGRAHSTLLAPRASRWMGGDGGKRKRRETCLAKAGFSARNPQVLKAAIRELASLCPAVQDGINEYGVFWRVEGPLRGPLADAMVVAIWIQWHIDGSFHFVTLKPLRG